METKPIERPTVRKVFKKTDFHKMLISQIVNNVGSFMSLITFPLYSFYLTANAIWLAFISAVMIIPTMLISPVAGMVVDSFDRKKIMIIANLFGALSIGCIFYLTTYSNIKNKEVLMIIFCFLILLVSSFQRFFSPAEEASLPKIVEKDEIGIAISITQTIFHIVLVIAPILAGVIIVTIGYGFVFLIDSSTYVISSIMIFLIKADLNPELKLINQYENADFEKPNLLLGTKKIFSIPSLRYIAILSLFMSFGSSITNTFLVNYAVVLNMTTIDYGFGLSLVGLSGIFSGLILTSNISKISKPLLLLTFGMFLNGCIWFFAGVNSKIWVLYLILIIGGTVNILVNVPSMTVLMQETSNNNRGQVFSSSDQLSRISSIFGVFLGGILINQIGVKALYLISGLTQFIVSIIGFVYLYLLFEKNNNRLNQNIEKVDVRLV